MASQYTKNYLQTNAEKGDGNGFTVQTFLAYTLKGKAKEYCSSYVRALENDLEDLRRKGDVYRSSSCRGGVAYYPASCPTLGELNARARGIEAVRVNAAISAACEGRQ